MTNRNDPCPCGSGQKYKKCCLTKDREAQRQQAREPESADLSTLIEREEPTSPSTNFTNNVLPTFEQDPLDERINEFWQAFSSAAYAQQWELVKDMLTNEPELCDREMIFEVANTLFGPAIQASETERIKDLLARIESVAPAEYEAELIYIADWRIQLALQEGDQDGVEHYFTLLSPHAAKDLDIYYQIVDVLAYYGKLNVLYRGMRQAWSYIANDIHLEDWISGEFAERIGEVDILYRLDKNPNLSVEDSTLQAHFTEYKLTIIQDLFAASLDYRNGRKKPSWKITDFKKTEQKGEEPEALALLLFAFEHYAVVEAGIAVTKVGMACECLGQYFALRQEGELGATNPRYRKRGSRKRSRKQRKIRSEREIHPLCPDAKSLDRYLGQLVGFLSFRYYRSFAMFEMIPLWLNFQVKYHLLSEESRKRTLHELSHLKGELIKLAENSLYDSTLVMNLRDWPYEI